jgi:hypothetical protein
MRSPLDFSKKSRILTINAGDPRVKNKRCYCLSYIYRRAPEREKKNQIIGMAKGIGHSFLSLNKVYMFLSVGHKRYVCKF